jgi:hypothetical protein
MNPMSTQKNLIHPPISSQNLKQYKKKANHY